MSKIDIRFVGTLVTTSPINITPPNSEVIQLDGGGKVNEVAVLPVVRNGEVEYLPVIPASTFRGKIRRAAVSTALKHLNEKPSLSAWLYSTLGGVKNDEKEDVYSILERKERRDGNPILGLFGASAPWDPSNALIAAAIPTKKVEAETVTAVRTDDFSRKPDIMDILDVDAGEAYLKMRQGTKDKVEASGDLTKARAELAKARREGSGSEELAALRTRVTELEQRETAAKAGAGNSTLMPHSHRILPAGVELGHKMTLRKVSEIEAGLFISALDHLFSEEPFFGGRLSLGYGQVEGSWDVEIRREGESWKNAGAISAETFQPISYDDETLKGFVGAWEAFAGSGALALEKHEPVKRERKAKKGDEPANA